MKSPLVSSQWLHDRLDDRELIVLDASQQAYASGIQAKSDFLQIPGARTFDLKNSFSLKITDLPHMLTSPEDFGYACGKLGINSTSKIVVYDALGVYFSPRVWWMFRVMGHANVFVLDGGLPDWIKNGFNIERKKYSVHNSGNFKADLNKGAIKSFQDIRANLVEKDFLLIDARPAERFKGLAPEPRKGLGRGNIEHSINIPYASVLDQQKFKTRQELSTLFIKMKIDERPLIFSCGSGVTACIVLLACELVLNNTKSVYDGSWTEYAQKTLAMKM